MVQKNPRPGRGTVKKIAEVVDNLSDAEKRRLQLILQIQGLYKDGTSVSEIGRRLKISRETARKYADGDPANLCIGFARRGGGKKRGILVPYRENILEMVRAGFCPSGIFRRIKQMGYDGSKSNVGYYIKKLCAEYSITVSKYGTGGWSGDWNGTPVKPPETNRHCGKSALDAYRGAITEMLLENVMQSEIARRVKGMGYPGSFNNARVYVGRVKSTLSRPDCPPERNGAETGRAGNIQRTKKEYVARTAIFEYIWMGTGLSEAQRDRIWKKYPVLYEIDRCVREFREIFTKKNMNCLYLFIDRNKNSSIKTLSSFARGLERDIEAVENAVSSEKSNGFVEGTNNRLKMLKRTMYGRGSHQLLEAKLIYR